jgi:hypothetical protein
MRQLEDYTRDELLALDYLDLLKLRKGAYLRQVARMREGEPEGTPSIPASVLARLEAWAALMAKRYGPEVRIWKNDVSWLEALLIVRYGEDPMQWPPAFSEADVTRAHHWRRGRTPQGVRYLDVEPSAGDRGSVLVGSLVSGWGLGWALPRFEPRLPRWLIGIRALLSALTDFLENELVDHLFRARSFTAPTDHFIALYTAAPGETGGGTEVSGGSYARVQVAAGFAEWLGTSGETTDVDSAGTGGATSNRNAITFPAPTADWGSVTHFASLDASTAGNMFFYGALTAAKTVNASDPAPSFPIGDLDVTLA